MKRALILIHGTFASDAEWIRPGSSFSRSLDISADVDIHPFVWSGSNSNEERVSASIKLQTFLRNLILNGYDDLAIVSHSHGGNILRGALDHEIGRHIASCIYLGTPFINRNIFDFEKLFKFIVISIFINLILFIISLFIFLISYINNVFDMYSIIRCTIFFVFLAFYVFLLSLRGIFKKIASMEIQTKAAFGWSTFIRAEDHVFSINGDEALLGLKAGNFIFSSITKCGHRLLKTSIEYSILIYNRIVKIPIYMWAILFVIFPLSILLISILTIWSIAISIFSLFGLLLFSIGIIPDVLGRRLTYGREPAIRYFMSLSSISRIPPLDESGACYLYRLDPKGFVQSTLRHSLYYSESRVASAISRIMEKRPVDFPDFEIEILRSSKKVERTEISIFKFFLYAITFFLFIMSLAVIFVTYNSTIPQDELSKTYNEILSRQPK